MKLITKRNVLIFLLVYFVLGFIIFSFFYSLLPTISGLVISKNPSHYFNMWTDYRFWYSVVFWPMTLFRMYSVVYF